MTHIEVQMNPNQNDIEVMHGAGVHRPSLELVRDATSEVPFAPALDAVRGRREHLADQRLVDRGIVLSRAGYTGVNEVRGINDNATAAERPKPGKLGKASSWLIGKVGGENVVDRTIDANARIKTKEELHMHESLGIDSYPRRQPRKADIQAFKLKEAAKITRKLNA